MTIIECEGATGAGRRAPCKGRTVTRPTCAVAFNLCSSLSPNPSSSFVRFFPLFMTNPEGKFNLWCARLSCRWCLCLVHQEALKNMILHECARAHVKSESIDFLVSKQKLSVGHLLPLLQAQGSTSVEVTSISGNPILLFLGSLILVRRR